MNRTIAIVCAVVAFGLLRVVDVSAQPRRVAPARATEGRRTLSGVLESLELSPEQQTQIRTLLPKYLGDYRNPAFSSELKKILTPEQGEKFERAVALMMSRNVERERLAAARLPLSSDVRVFEDVVYRTVPGVDSNSTSLDLYAPKTGASRPIMVFIHGGGWRKGDKANVTAKPQRFVDEGYVFASVNYRLAQDSTYRDQGQDVAKSIAWIQSHAAEYGGDPDRIFLMGHSAGAHLAALVATDERYLDAEALTPGVLKGVVLLDGGGYDIPLQVTKLGTPKARQTYTTVFGDDPAVQKDASPITHVATGKGIPPFLIIHVATRLASRIQSERLANALRDADVEARVEPAHDKTHATLNRELGLAGDKPTEQVFEFLHQTRGAASVESVGTRSVDERTGLSAFPGLREQR